MKRVLLSLVATVVGLIALLSFKTHGQPLAPVGGLPSASVPSSPPSSAPSSSPRTPASTSAPPAQTGKRRIVGAAVETRYGFVQVAVTVTGSHIDAVDFVRLDAFDGHSQQINQEAAPILLRETLQAQSAHVDTVSGATYTSDGYVQSLQSALDQAGIK